MEARPNFCYFVVLSSKSAFFKLDNVLPECSLYQELAPKLEPLVCLRENVCHVGRNCMDTLVRRVHTLFGELLPTVQVLVLYFRKRTRPGYGAGLFWRDLREPRVITMNSYAWKTVCSRGRVYQYTPSESFYLTGRTDTEISSRDNL
jgi:hypothetical protein